MSSRNLTVGQPVAHWACDAAYVVSNACKLGSKEVRFGKARRGPLYGAHGDVWLQVKHFVDSGSLCLPTKVKSHSLSNASIVDTFLNAIADCCATVAAAEYTVNPTLEEELLYTFDEAFRICMRLAVIENSLSEWRKHNEVTRFLPVPSVPIAKEQYAKEVKEHIKLAEHVLVSNTTISMLGVLSAVFGIPSPRPNNSRPSKRHLALEWVGKVSWLSRLIALRWKVRNRECRPWLVPCLLCIRSSGLITAVRPS